MNFFQICLGRNSKGQVVHTLRATGSVDFNTSSSVKMKDYTVCVQACFIPHALHGSSGNLGSGSVFPLKVTNGSVPLKWNYLKVGNVLFGSIHFISVCS